jgi:putative addiction module killer protein
VLELIVYQQATGERPFERWFEKLRDKRAQSRILIRLRHVQAGSFGDCKPVGEGVLDLRIDVGAGYRVYCGRLGGELVILLCGGDKSSQSKDIELAKKYWTDWKRSRNAQN